MYFKGPLSRGSQTPDPGCRRVFWPIGAAARASGHGRGHALGSWGIVLAIVALLALGAFGAGRFLALGALKAWRWTLPGLALLTAWRLTVPRVVQNKLNT